MKLSYKKNSLESSQVLKFFFDQKKKHQPAYSLRALSRDVGLSQSYVSEIFSGKKIPTPNKIKVLSKALGMDVIARRNYEENLLKDLFPRPKTKKRKGKGWNPATPVDGSALRKWYYHVILYLVDCKGFKSEPAWIAKRIGIKPQEASEALQWLSQNSFLKEENGKLCRTHKKFCFSTSRPLSDFRIYHKQMIELALLELTQKTDRASFERRLMSGISFTCNPKKLEAAKKKILEVIYEVADDLMEGDCTEVYQINLQLFPHTCA